MKTQKKKTYEEIIKPAKNYIVNCKLQCMQNVKLIEKRDDVRKNQKTYMK